MKKKLCFVLIFCSWAVVPLTHADVSQFGSRKGPTISLGVNGMGMHLLNNSSFEELSSGETRSTAILPGLSLTLGYGANERQLYYMETFLSPPDLGMGLGYRYFLLNYDKVYTFGNIGTAIFPIPSSSEAYADWLPLLGTPSVLIRGGIGYQWARYSTIELSLVYGHWFSLEYEDYTDEEYQYIAAYITLRGILW